MININLDNIKTLADVRDALQQIKESIDGSVLEKGEWFFVEIDVTAAATDLGYSHNQRFTPKDVIQLSASNGATVTWHFDDFDSTNVYLSTTGPCTVRAYVGRHREGS
jgi:hypothetical protein